MIIISHRGNIDGPNLDLENSPNQIETAINKGFDVEIDLHYIDGKFFLGHDMPKYEIELEWLLSRSDKLWIHCKNLAAFVYLNLNLEHLNYFWHERDTVTLTSLGFIWAYVGKQPIKNSIAVMPEINNDDISECVGICSDFPTKYSI